MIEDLLSRIIYNLEHLRTDVAHFITLFHISMYDEFYDNPESCQTIQEENQKNSEKHKLIDKIFKCGRRPEAPDDPKV